MGRHLTDERRQGGLLLWVIYGSGLTIRDLWLTAHDGGAAPCWLLRAETIAFGLSTMSSLSALKSWSRAADRARSEALKTAAATGVAAVLIHGVRLSIYLRANRAKPG